LLPLLLAKLAGVDLALCRHGRPPSVVGYGLDLSGVSVEEIRAGTPSP